MEIVWFLLIGLIAGWLAGFLVKGGANGLIGNMAIGVVGALIGGYLFSFFGIAAGGLLGNIVVATIGAVVFLTVVRMLRKS
jgi:uncharacterized membrane protein YeaQ/YmgE (transglycosylase-associated protein family)